MTTTLPVFDAAQRSKAHALLIATVAHMMGRKLEEADWIEVYCRAKGLDTQDWSNLYPDVVFNGIGVQQKMLRTEESREIRALCGTRQMHPAATRSFRISSSDSPDVAMNSVMQQYAELFQKHEQFVNEKTGSASAELRSGWLLYQSSLREFMYFEEPLVPLDPAKHYATWSERKASGKSARKSSKNLWVYEKGSDLKVWSVTTEAGAKIQPYFKVPPPTDPNLYIFVAQGFRFNELVKVWLTTATAESLKKLVGTLDTAAVSDAIISTPANPATDGVTLYESSVTEVTVTEAAYEALLSKFPGVSDEHSFQLLVKQMINSSE